MPGHDSPTIVAGMCLLVILLPAGCQPEGPARSPQTVIDAQAPESILPKDAGTLKDTAKAGIEAGSNGFDAPAAQESDAAGTSGQDTAQDTAMDRQVGTSTDARAGSREFYPGEVTGTIKAYCTPDGKVASGKEGFSVSCESWCKCMSRDIMGQCGAKLYTVSRCMSRCGQINAATLCCRAERCAYAYKEGFVGLSGWPMGPKDITPMQQDSACRMADGHYYTENGQRIEAGLCDGPDS